MWRILWEKHRGAFCFAVGMVCFLIAGLLVRALPSVRSHLLSLPPPSRNVQDVKILQTPRAENRGDVSPKADLIDAAPASGEWFLYVTGSVRRPGVYRLPPGVRAVHLVEAAGGLDGFADPVAINLAQPLLDGMHIHVPRKGDRPPQETFVIAAPRVRSAVPGMRSEPLDKPLIDVNRASENELTALRGIGPALARRIIAYREENGFFRSVEELALIRGIGAAKLEGFRDQATVGP